MIYAIAAYYPQNHGGCGAPWGEVFGYAKTEESAADAMIAKAMRVAEDWSKHHKLEDITIKYSAYMAFPSSIVNNDPRSFPICPPSEAVISGKIYGVKVEIRVCFEPLEELPSYY